MALHESDAKPCFAFKNCPAAVVDKLLARFWATVIRHADVEKE